jgi:hypothetical protein
MNTLQSTSESRLDTFIVPHENPELEELWTRGFGDEYKPENVIAFDKLLEFMTQRGRQYHKDFQLCKDISLKQSSSTSISFLNSLEPKEKRFLADFFLQYIPFEEIKERK